MQPVWRNVEKVEKKGKNLSEFGYVTSYSVYAEFHKTLFQKFKSGRTIKSDFFLSKIEEDCR